MIEASERQRLSAVLRWNIGNANYARRYVKSSAEARADLKRFEANIRHLNHKIGLIDAVEANLKSPEATHLSSNPKEKEAA